MKTTKLITVRTLAALLLTCGLSLAPAQQPSVPGRVAALKASLEASQIVLKQYEWIETTVVSLKGEKNSSWEGGYRVPAMLRWPGVIKPGMEINAIGSHEFGWRL